MTIENTAYDFDFFIIGGGSGGVRAARWAVALGAKVAICEEDRFGGTCVLRGCIPKKMMVYGSHFLDDIVTAKDYGFDIEVNGHDWKAFKETREKELSRLSGLYQKMLEGNGVTLISGKGIIKGENQVEVAGKTFSAKYILIAVGGRPWAPAIEGIEKTINSNQFLLSENKPKKVIINGGGFIGMEFACVLNNFGTEVHVVIRKDKILRGFDEEAATYLQEQMKKSGIHFHCHQELSKIEGEGPYKVLITDSAQKSTQTTIEHVDQVIMATGRRPYLEGLGLENAGVEIKDSAIKVDAYSQTNIPSIFAVGDATDRMNLTPIALQEGMLVAELLFSNRKTPMTYENVPSAVFSQPPLATVGKTEEEVLSSGAKEGQDFDVYTSEFRPLKYTLGDRQKRTFMKMIVEKKSDKVLGLHMVGDDAAEIIQGFAVALKAGATKAIFDQTIGLHPSSAEEFVTMRKARTPDK